MKTNKKHIIIPALMAAVGVGLVGSISGTVAWYQYSTRVTAAYIGTSMKASENLQIKVLSVDETKDSTASGHADAYWQDLTSETVSGVINGATAVYGNNLTPITTGEQAKNAALPAKFKGNPIYQYAATSSWADATIANYVQFKLSFRALDVDGGASAAYLAKNVYLTNLTIMDNAANSTSGKGTDLSDAVRVHIAAPGKTGGSAVNALFSKSGANTNVYGKLDVNNDGVLDKTAGYEWDSTSDVTYGDDGKVQAAYAANDSAIVATDTNATLTGGTALCTTLANGNDVTITVTIWLEGWQKLDNIQPGNAGASGTESAIWDPAKYGGAKFNVGMRFAIQPVDVADY